MQIPEISARILRIACSLAIATCSLLGLVSSGLAHAESKLILPYPTDLGVIPATTYNAEGEWVGDTTIVFEQVALNLFRLKVEARIENGARNTAVADLEVVGDGEGLRLVSERSESHDRDGKSLGLLEIDHVSGLASCSQPDKFGSEPSRLAIPADDRVANVPMNVLFLPLIRGEVDKVEFQIFLCRGGPRFMDFVAERKGQSKDAGEHQIVEVRYAPDLGPLLSWAAAQVTPDLSFWFDTSGDGQYAGHRMPLYQKGPVVTVLRKDISQDLIRP